MEELQFDPLLSSLEEMIVNNQWNDVFFIDNDDETNEDDPFLY